MGLLKGTINGGINEITLDTVPVKLKGLIAGTAPGEAVVWEQLEAGGLDPDFGAVTATSLAVSGTTDSTSKDTGSIVTDGGIGVEKAIFAGTTVSVGTVLDVGTNQTFAKEVNHSVAVTTTTTAATAGGNLALAAGAGATSGAGGVGSLAGGAGGATGTGGAVNITSGAGGATSGNSGAVAIASADETSTDSSGQVFLNSGATASANSGAIGAVSGIVSTTGNSGTATFGSGNSTTTGDSGTVTLKSGTAGTGNSGVVTVSSGNATTGNSGNINITPGTSSSVTVASAVVLNNGVVRKPFSTSVASGGTVTGPQLLKGLITCTGATGNWQLPTAAQITTALGATPTGTIIEFYVNAAGMTATNTATLVVGTNMTVQSAPPITGGGTLTVTQDTQVMAKFILIYDSATTCKIARLA